MRYPCNEQFNDLKMGRCVRGPKESKEVDIRDKEQDKEDRDKDERGC
jgi:hypothetical protein